MLTEPLHHSEFSNMGHFTASCRFFLTSIAFNVIRIKWLARQTIRGSPPSSESDWQHSPAVKELASAYSKLATEPAYWSTQVWMALVTSLALCVLSFAILGGHTSLAGLGASQITVSLIGVAGLSLAIVALAEALRDHGPTLLNATTFAAAERNLYDSLDDQVQSRSLLRTLLLITVIAADGVLMGTAITPFFEERFTPIQANIAAVSWGIFTAVVLYKLAHLAANEMRTNKARATVRRLESSGDPASLDLAQRFLSVAGSRIGHDRSDRRSYKARVALFLVALFFAFMTALLRVIPSSDHESPLAPVALKIASYTDDRSDIGFRPMFMSTTESTFGVPLRTAISAILLAGVIVISSAVACLSLASSTPINRLTSPANLAVVRQYKTAHEVDAFNRKWMHHVVAAFNKRLQRLSREVDIAKSSLPPLEQRKWPPLRLHAADVLADSWQQSGRVMRTERGVT